jgi:hypothetical protein
MEDYYLKYLIYKSKYLTLKDGMTQDGGAGKFSCNPNTKFIDICRPDDNGMYHSKEKCVNDCETKYINTHLIRAKLKHEATQFKLFIDELMKEGLTIYIKGGTVLGLQILKMLCNKYSGKEFEKVFNEFLKTELIRDWDFAAYTETTIDESYRAKMDKLAKKFNLVPRAKTFILYQARFPIRINEQALFEIALLDNTDINLDLELPLTTMKVKVNRRNINYVFMLAKCFSSKDPIDLDVIKYIMKDMNIIIPENKNGLFKFDKLYTGELSSDMKALISDMTKKDIYLQQFLITHIHEPNRMLYRLLEKNIPKVNKINTFLRETNLDTKVSWLFDSQFILNTVEQFIDLVGSKVYSFIKNGKKPIDIINNIDKFFNGINLFRIETEYPNIQCKGRDLIKVLFERVYKELFSGKDTPNVADSKLIKLMNFLIKQKLFVTN